MNGVYLIHFDQPYHHARHYVGFSEDIETRLTLHRLNRGARLLQVVNGAGILWRLVRVWPGATRAFERWIKDQHDTARFCPVCRHEAQLQLWTLLDCVPPVTGLDFALSWDDIQPIAFD